MVRIAAEAGWTKTAKHRKDAKEEWRGERRVGVGVRGGRGRAQSRKALAVKREVFLSVGRPKRQICVW